MHSLNKLSKESRLTAPASFQRVYKNAKRFRYQGITLLVCTNEFSFSRIGFSIPKKQISRAIDRNRIRRVIKEYFRVNKNKLTVNLDLVFIIYSTLAEYSNLEITQCLETLWEKLQRFYEKA